MRITTADGYFVLDGGLDRPVKREIYPEGTLKITLLLLLTDSFEFSSAFLYCLFPALATPWLAIATVAELIIIMST